jgi:hypothetical protein
MMHVPRTGKVRSTPGPPYRVAKSPCDATAPAASAAGGRGLAYGHHGPDRLGSALTDGAGVTRGRAARLRALVAGHPGFAVIFVMGALLRLVATLGYRPALYFNDSFDYIFVAVDPFPHPLRPDGYSFLLLLLRPLHSFAAVAVVQHLMGLAMGLMIYAVLRRRFGLPGWGATLAAAPVLLDGYQIQLEHLILSDVPFMFLVVAAVTLLLWHERPGRRAAVSIGLLLAAAWLTRTVGLPVLLGVCAYLVIRRAGWRPVATVLVACAVPMAAYMTWFQSAHGKFAVTESNGVFLFARAYKFADCRKIPDLTVDEQQLYEFETTTRPLPVWGMDDTRNAADVAIAYEDGPAAGRVVEPFAGVIRLYQNYVYVRGTMVGVLLLVGLAGMVPLWRRLGGAAFLPWTLATGLLLVPAATVEFDYRYVLPAVPLASLAAGIAFAGPLGAALSRRRRNGTVPDEPHDTDHERPAITSPA